MVVLLMAWGCTLAYQMQMGIYNTRAALGVILWLNILNIMLREAY